MCKRGGYYERQERLLHNVQHLFRKIYTPSLTLGNHLMIFSLLQTLTHANQCIIFFSQEHNISVCIIQGLDLTIVQHVE